MIPDVWTVSFDAPLEDVVRLMERHHIKRVPVVEGGKIVGIVCKRAITSDQDEPSAKSPCTSTTLRAFSAVAFTAAPRAEINETAAAVSSVVEKVRLFIIMNPFKAKWFGVRGPQAPPIRTPEDMVANLSTKWDAERKPRLLRHRTPRGTMPQITVHVVFDTNSILCPSSSRPVAVNTCQRAYTQILRQHFTEGLLASPSDGEVRARVSDD
jgi:hypothetical protein